MPHLTPSRMVRRLLVAATTSVAIVGPLASCGGGSNSAQQATTAPQDACTAQQTLRRYGETTPPGYAAILAWANAMTSSGTQSPTTTARIEVDYIRLLQADTATGPTTLVADAAEEYALPRAQLSVNEGAAYPRVPRCSPGASSTAIGSSPVAAGVLTIDLAPIPDKYAHWWTPQATLTAGKRYFVESRFRVTGGAYIQFGIDYWRSKNAPYAGYDETCLTSNNCEGWVSKWFGDTGGQFVIQRVPVL